MSTNAIASQGVSPGHVSSTYAALEVEAPRLFSSGSGIQTIVLARSGEPIEQEVIPDAQALQEFFELRLQNHLYEGLFYIFEQKNTWSRFEFISEMINLILEKHSVFPSIIDCLKSFGQKSTDDMRIWDGCYCKPLVNFELCYTLRYFERNGRTTGNTWSLRQTAIYQQYDEATKHWVCFLVQPSRSFRAQLLVALSPTSGLRMDPPLIHRLCFKLTLSEFGDYVDAIHADVVKLSHKACFSTIGKSLKHDFEVSFHDLQSLQLLKQKLLRANRVLDSSRSVCTRLRQCMLIVQETNSLEELANYASLIEVHARHVAMSLRFANETDSLLSKVLDARRDEVLLQTNAAMQANLEMLKRIAFIAGEENQKLSKISSSTLKDSSTLKALTTIATMYLPASLIATIFSSGLVRLRVPLQDDSVRKGFALATEFWIYIVATVLLTGLTLGLLLLLKRSWKSCLPCSYFA